MKQSVDVMSGEGGRGAFVKFARSADGGCTLAARAISATWRRALKPPTATPLHIVQSFFRVELKKREVLEKFARTSDDEWLAFASYYVDQMDTHFPTEFLDTPETGQRPLRLYFEPRMRDAWDTALEGRNMSPTPLLGVRPDPPSPASSRDDVSRMLDPLKKHLLLANSAYVRDSFYYSFDSLVDAVDREAWRDDPTAVRLV
jgi:hypothetical protein